MKNWVVKLLVLLFIPSLAGILFTVALGFNPGAGYKLRRMLSLRYSLSPEGLYHCFKMENSFSYIDGGCQYGL